MKQFEFNHANKQWDHRKVFHCTQRGFTEFENGELIIHNTHIDYRTHQYKYDVEMTTTRDCGRQLYLDVLCTQPVKKAWLLQGGQQDMALDHQQKVAVHLYGGYRGAPKSRELPKQYHGAHAFWPRANQLPIPLTQFTVSKPDRSIKKELIGKLDDIRAAITAAIRINPAKHRYHTTDRKYLAPPRWLEMSVTGIVASLTSGTDYSDDRDRYAIAHNGFSYPRADTYHDYLYFK
tara:strand:+ start:412 stop:1113 length:702 start_codon:yes stop_codon:yes gene_type:complete